MAVISGREFRSRRPPYGAKRALTKMEEEQKILAGELGAAVLLGHPLAVAFLGKLHSLSYSRDVESRADLTGTDACAATWYNPWGLVWLFQDFKDANVGEVPQLLSDHPNDENRIQALEQHFSGNPSVFGKFNPDPKLATPFVVPKNVPESFLR